MPQTVVRERLIRRLAQAGDATVALLVAPAGYGKTTLLAQWAEHDPRPFAFVSAREADGEQLLQAVAGMPAQFVLALDVAEALPAAAMPALAELADRLPPGYPSWRSPRVASRRCRSGACAPSAACSSCAPRISR